MRTFIDNTLTSLREYFGKMSRRRKLILLALSVAVVVLAIVVVALLSRTVYTTLYVAQNDFEASQIYNALTDMGVPVKYEGSTILVPEKRLTEIKMTLASQGAYSDVPALDILNQATGFGVTDSQSLRLAEYQKSEDIRSQIITSEKIQSCKANVIFGATSPYIGNKTTKEAICSVVLTLKRGETLTGEEAQSIAEIVRTSVPGIKYENISITDSLLKSYPVGDNAVVEKIDPSDDYNARVTLQNQLNQQFEKQVEQFLAPIWGAEHVTATARARLNFDSENIDSVEFAPPVSGELDGMIRSESRLYESQGAGELTGGIPGTDTNGMGAEEYPYDEEEAGENYRRTLYETNYEINETRTQIEKALGRVESLSIMVVVDDAVVEGDITERVRALLSSGMGVPQSSVGVEQLEFLQQGKTLDQIMAEEEAYAKQQSRQELIQTIIRWGVILLLGIAIILLIRAIVRVPKEKLVAEAALAGGGVGAIDYITDDDITDLTDLTEYGTDEGYPMGAEYLLTEGEDADMALNKKPSGLDQIERFIDKDPNAVAQLLRNWLSEEEE